MDFSKYEQWMGKSGWKRGQGLGRNEDGITKAIHIDKKKNTLGVGSTGFKHDNNWWDKVWDNKKIGSDEQNELFETRSSVNKNKNSDQETDDEKEEDNTDLNNNNLSCKGGLNSFKNKKDKIMNEIKNGYEKEKKENDSLLYGKFTKSTFVLESETIENVDKLQEISELEEKDRLKFLETEKENEQNTRNQLAEKSKQEFEACKGRTLRKYAPIGKLERLKAQEEGRYNLSEIKGDGGQKYENYKRKLADDKKSLQSSESSESSSSKKQKLEDEEEKEVKKEKKEKKEKKKSSKSSSDSDEEKQVKKDKKDKKKKSKSSSSSDEEKQVKVKKTKDRKEKKEKKDKKDKKEKKEKKDKKDKKEKK